MKQNTKACFYSYHIQSVVYLLNQVLHGGVVKLKSSLYPIGQAWCWDEAVGARREVGLLSKGPMSQKGCKSTRLIVTKLVFSSGLNLAGSGVTF